MIPRYRGQYNTAFMLLQDYHYPDYILSTEYNSVLRGHHPLSPHRVISTPTSPFPCIDHQSFLGYKDQIRPSCWGPNRHRPKSLTSSSWSS